MTRLSRENFLITGFVCILFGASMSVAGLGPMAITVGLFGVVSVSYTHLTLPTKRIV